MLSSTCLISTFTAVASAEAALDIHASNAHLLTTYGQQSLEINKQNSDDDFQSLLSSQNPSRIVKLGRYLQADIAEQNWSRLHRHLVLLKTAGGADVSLRRLTELMTEIEADKGNILSNVNQSYLENSDPFLRIIAGLEQSRRLLFRNHISSGLSLLASLEQTIQMSDASYQPLLIPALTLKSKFQTKIGDSEGVKKTNYELHDLVFRYGLSTEKMNAIYNLSVANIDENPADANAFLQIYHKAILKNNLTDLASKEAYLCSRISLRLEEYARTVSCLKNTRAATGRIETIDDYFNAQTLTIAYARLNNVSAARTMLQRVNSTPPSIIRSDPRFDSLAQAYILKAEGHAAEAFNLLEKVREDDNKVKSLMASQQLSGLYGTMRDEVKHRDDQVKSIQAQAQLKAQLMAALMSIFVLTAGLAGVAVAWALNTRRAGKVLLSAKEMADRANASKSRFLAMVSHELRTPLNGMMGIAQVLQKRGFDGELGHQIDILTASGRTLASILNDLLDLSRIEAGRIEIKSKPMPIGPILERIIGLYGPVAKAKQVDLRLESPANLDVFLTLDERLVFQCVSNLVSNALKFTDTGYVKLSLELSPRANDDLWNVVISVFDSGRGISRDLQEQIFEPFSSLDDESKAQGGAGLGLSISRKICQAMGGDLVVMSQAGQGSIFKMNFTAKRCVTPSKGSDTIRKPEIDVQRLNGKKILIVDDHAVNRRLITLLLEPFGVKISEASDGQEALNLGMAHFDVVLMDLNMPNLNGLDTVRQFRAQEAPDQHLPILALSARSQADQVAEALKIGIDGYVQKPLELDILLSRVIEALPSPDVMAVKPRRSRKKSA